MSNIIIDSIDNLKNKESNILIQNLIQSINCPICQDLITQPILIPNCGHSFCYSCLKHWSQCNPSCPVCRKSIENNKPVINHSLRKLINLLFDELKNNKLKEWRTDKDKEYLIDEKNGFPWLTKIENNFGRAIVDNEDGVPRCSSCHWELIDGLCENCGRMMVGWQPRTDGDDLDNEDEEQEEQEEEQEDDDWEDYDNGIRDMNRRRSVNYDEYEEENEDEDEDEDNEGDRTNVYSYDNEEDYLDLHANEDNSNNKSIRKSWSRSEPNSQFLLHDENEELIPREGKDRLQSFPINEIMLKNYKRNITDDLSASSYVSDDGFVVDDDEDLEETEDSEDYSDEISDADATQNVRNEKKDKQIKRQIEEDEFDDDSVIFFTNNKRNTKSRDAAFISLDSDYESDEEIKNFQSRRKKILLSEDDDDIEEVKHVQQIPSPHHENGAEKELKRKKDKKKWNKSKNKIRNKKRHKHKHPEPV